MIGSDLATERLKADLTAALSSGDVHVVFQPIVRLWNHEPVCLEALVRWRHPHYGLIAAEPLLACAERASLLHQVSLLVLAAAGRALRSAPPAMQVAVNACAAELRSTHFLGALISTLGTLGLPPERFLVEIPLATLRALPEAVATMGEKMAAHGLRLVIEHVAASDLPQVLALQPLPMAVKIDVRLIGAIGLDRAAEAEIISIVTRAKSAGVAISAVGVETERQAAFLLNCDCPFAQGWLFGPPRLDGFTQQCPPVH